MIHIGGPTNKPSARHMRESFEKNIAPLHRSRQQQSRLVLPPLPLAIWFEDLPPEKRGRGSAAEVRRVWAAEAVLTEISKGLFHLLSLPAFLGMILFRRHFLEVPGMWVMLTTGLTLTVLLYFLAESNGYVAERHVLLIVMGGLYFAVPVVVLWGSWLARQLSRWRPGLSGSTVSLVLLLLVTAASLSNTMARLHGDRQGFKQAGLWLAKHAAPGEAIIDPYAWSSYYAGRVFHPADPAVKTRTGWVVLEVSGNTHHHLDFYVNDAQELVKNGQPVKSFERQKKKHLGTVVVYRVEKAGLIEKVVK